MAEPDDPLRADDPLVGAEHEDVLLGSGTAEEREPAAEPVDSVQDDLDENPTFVATLDDRPTTELPRVVAPTPAPEPTTWSGGVAPWAVFAAVAVVVIAATTTLASWLQGPTSERQGFTGLTQPFPTATSAPPAPVEAAPAAPPSAEPEPEPEPEPAARPTQRPRATKAPAPAAPRPPAAAVNGRATPNGEEKEEPASTTSAPSLPAAADAGAAGPGAADTGAADTDGEKESTEADNAKPETDEDSDESEDG